jgi:hypothetical protein
MTRRAAMRTSEAFILGAIVGAAVTLLWGRKIEEYVEAKAGKALDRGGDALRRADALLQDTKQHVRKTLRAGRAAIHPAPAATDA